MMAPSSGVTGGLSVGASIAILAVWYLDTHVLATPMPGFVATAAGSLVTAAITYAVQLLDALLSKVR